MITYSLCNPCGRCDTGTVVITLSGYPCNVHHPIVVSDTDSVCKNTDLIVHVLSNDYDPDGGTVHLSGVYTQPTNGIIAELGDTAFLYHPNAGFVGVNKRAIKDLECWRTVVPIAVRRIHFAAPSMTRNISTSFR